MGIEIRPLTTPEMVHGLLSVAARKETDPQRRELLAEVLRTSRDFMDGVISAGEFTACLRPKEGELDALRPILAPIEVCIQFTNDRHEGGRSAALFEYFAMPMLEEAAVLRDTGMLLGDLEPGDLQREVNAILDTEAKPALEDALDKATDETASIGYEECERLVRSGILRGIAVARAAITPTGRSERSARKAIEYAIKLGEERDGGGR